MKYIKINKADNVIVSLTDLKAGEKILDVTLINDIKRGHKIALTNIKSGGDIIKYGNPIGVAIADIAAGEHVHTHNIKTKLSGIVDYNYSPKLHTLSAVLKGKSFNGYNRKNGDVAIRNEIWIIPTVGCVNEIAAKVRKLANEKFGSRSFDGVNYFPHPYGCSQMGDDHATTRLILADLAKHPNAGGVLILGLGCENNSIKEFKKQLGDYDTDRIRFLVAQDVADEIQTALGEIESLVAIVEKDKRVSVSFSKLNIGLKCGGSDGLSGITANPLLGAFSDAHTSSNGTTVLTEVPEMFGAETLLMERAESQEVFNRIVEMVNNFKDYYIKHDQVIYENPSPGNKDGGITTLEDKSLGCTQKGGTGTIVDVLKYGEQLKKSGLNLLEGPGNDIVAVTALAAAKVHITLFTTGRGTPLGSPVPVIKVSTNSELANKKSGWIDFNAGVLADGASMDETVASFITLMTDVASGKKTKNEVNDYRDIAIFKDGVTL